MKIMKKKTEQNERKKLYIHEQENKNKLIVFITLQIKNILGRLKYEF